MRQGNQGDLRKGGQITQNYVRWWACWRSLAVAGGAQGAIERDGGEEGELAEDAAEPAEAQDQQGEDGGEDGEGRPEERGFVFEEGGAVVEDGGTDGDDEGHVGKAVHARLRDWRLVRAET